MTDTTSLYRHFAADGSLLYVGISLSWPQRTRSHARHARWFEEVARVEIEHFPTREAALGAEREAIKSEKPRFNVVHNRPTATKPAERWKRPLRTGDTLLDTITGPDVIVGPALVYRDDQVSIIIGQGEFGAPGDLVELVIGTYFGEMPDWADFCHTVMSIRRPNDITIVEARERRDEIIAKLRKHLRTVESYDTDLSLAVANASRFPSPHSRKVLDDLVREKELAA